jgi:parallel beta-helix repeat protein
MIAMCYKTCIVAIVVSALLISMLDGGLVVNVARANSAAETVGPLFNLDLVYAYAQMPYATVVFNVTRLADFGVNSSITLVDVYRIDVFSNGALIGSQGLAFLSNNNVPVTTIMGLVTTFPAVHTSVADGPDKVGQSSLESFSLTLDNSIGNDSVTVERLQWITINQTSTQGCSPPNQTIAQVNLEKFNDGYLYNTVVPQHQLTQINLLHPIHYLQQSTPQVPSQKITINANGDIAPSNAAIKRSGNTYTITADLRSPIIIEENSIIINGGNHTLQGPGQNQNSIAVSLTAANVTVENMRITNWNVGILGVWNNNTITNNEFTNNYQSIVVYDDDYVVRHNAISNSATALFIDTGAYQQQGDNNLITQNQIINNSEAFDITNSNGTTITTNNVMNNDFILALARNTLNSILYKNNFINNSQVLDISVSTIFPMNIVPFSPAGQWDNGAVGNYWSDYLTTYPQATEIAHSGIGNTPYVINDTLPYTFSSSSYVSGGGSTYLTGIAVLGTAIDNYPLMAPTSIPTITLTPPLPTASPSIPESMIFTITFAVVALLAVAIALLVAIRKITLRH